MHGIRVIIIEDNPYTRESLQLFFDRSMANGGRARCIGTFDSFESAERKISELQPDVILLDLAFPGSRDGVDATRAIVRRWPLIKVLILSVQEAHDQIVMALRAGAIGFLDKGTPMATIEESIGRAYNGGRILSPRAADSLVNHLQKLELPFKELSHQEKRVLDYHGRGSSDKEIASQLSISEHTVREYKRRILEKTGTPESPCRSIGQAAHRRKV